MSDEDIILNLRRLEILEEVKDIIPEAHEDEFISYLGNEFDYSSMKEQVIDLAQIYKIDKIN